MDVAAFVDRLARQPFYEGQIEHVEQLPPRDGQFAEPQNPLPEALANLLCQRGPAEIPS